MVGATERGFSCVMSVVEVVGVGRWGVVGSAPLNARRARVVEVMARSLGIHSMSITFQLGGGKQGRNLSELGQ